MSGRGTGWNPGRNYVGSRTFTREEMAKPVPRELQRRGAILQDLARALKLPIQEGKLRTRSYRPSKGVGGFYQPRSELLRIKKWGDVEVAGHEIVHALADRHPSFRRLFEEPRFQQELRELSYDRRSAEEGLSEFGRLWFSQSAKLAEVPTRRGRSAQMPGAGQPRTTPELRQAWEDAIASLPAKQQRAIRKARDQMHEYFGQGALAELRTKRGEEGTRAAGDVLENFGDRMREGVSDRMHGLLKLERATTGGQMADGPWRAAGRLAGMPWIRQGLYERGTPYWTEINGKRAIRFNRRGLRDILAEVGQTRKEVEAFFDYATARQARELAEQGRENLFSDQAIEAGLRLENAVRKRTFEEMKKFQREVVDFAIEGGVLNPRNVERWRRTDYAFSFNRDMTGSKRRGGGGASGGLTSKNPIRELRGSSRNILDPIVNAIDGPTRLIQATLENQARRKVAELASRPGAGRFLHELAAESELVRLHQKNVFRTLEKYAAEHERQNPGAVRQTAALRHGIEQMRALGEHGLPDVLGFWAGGKTPKGENVMTVLEGGKPRYYEILDDQLVRALESFRPEPPGFVMKWWDKLRRFKQTMITLDPSFLAANFIRDPLMASIMTRTGHQAITSALRGQKHVWTKSDVFWDFIANGGGGASARESASVLERDVVRYATRQGFPRNLLVVNKDDVARVLRTVFGVLEDTGRKIEMAPKVGEYVRAIEQGRSAGEAASMGREVNTDYAMHGNAPMARFMAQTMPFFNAMVASSDRVWRAVAREEGHRFATFMKIGLVGMASAALYGWNRQHPEYLALSPEEKAAYWHYFVYAPGAPLANERGFLHVKLPKIWEAGAIGTLAELTMAAGLEDESMGHVWREALATLTHNFGLSAPVGIDMALEQAYNRSLYTGAPLEPIGVQDMDPADRVRDSASETMRQFGREQRELGVPSGLQLSPARAEALLRGLFGNWASYGLGATDRMFYPGKRVASHVDDYAVLSRFLERPGGRSRWPTEFYNMAQELDQMQGSAKAARERGDQRALEFYDSRYIGLAQAFDRTRRQITGIRDQAAMVRNGPYTPEARRRLLDRLEKDEHALEERMVKQKRALDAQIAEEKGRRGR